MKSSKITFFPDHKTVSAENGSTILDAAREAGIYIQSVCGGEGVCGKCRVKVVKGNVKAEPTGFLKQEEIDQGYVLACATKVFENIEVEIPLASRLEEGAILLEGKKPRGLDLYSSTEAFESAILEEAQVYEHSSLATKIYLELPESSLQDQISDLDRVYRELRKKHRFTSIQTGLVNIKNLANLLRQHQWKITVTMAKRNDTNEVVFIEGGDTSQKHYGVAVDIGTTTVVVHLVDLVTQKTLGVMGSFNNQISYGDDVISRIIFASEKEGLAKLHLTVINNINTLISALVKENHIKLEDISAVTCAGNTTMIHFLLNIDPTYIRKEPYIPVVTSGVILRAAEVGIKVQPRGLMACAPNVSSYVGGDVTAGVLVSGMTEREELSMYIDMGTNGEIVLGNKDWLASCACSIGPAFEGSGVKSGTRAIKGAIQQIEISNDYEPVLDTIGKVKPQGICGSGLIELICEMMKTGMVNRAGKISTTIKTPRIRKGDEGLEYVIVRADKSATGKDIVITQADLDNLIRSKAAVFAGIRTLLKKMGFICQDVQRFYIAGGFGSHLDISKGICVGLLPDLPIEKFRYIGNGSVTGAKSILISYLAMTKAKKIADKMTYVELSNDNLFHEEFVSAMFLPHTDLSLFPSAR